MMREMEKLSGQFPRNDVASARRLVYCAALPDNVTVQYSP